MAIGVFNVEHGDSYGVSKTFEGVSKISSREMIYHMRQKTEIEAVWVREKVVLKILKCLDSHIKVP